MPNTKRPLPLDWLPRPQSSLSWCSARPYSIDAADVFGDCMSEGPSALISAATVPKATVASPKGRGLSELSISPGLHGELV